MHIDPRDQEQARNWRRMFGAAETLQRVRPDAAVEDLNNPHEGTTTFQRFEGDALEADHAWHDERGPVTFAPPPGTVPHPCDHYPATRVAYCRWPWRVLEPAKGAYRLEIIAQALEAAAARRQSLQIRFQPFVHNDIPEWHRALGGRVLDGGGSTPEIDSNDPLYIKHWTTFVRAVGRAFNGHPNLESVDVAYAGRFGECGGNADETSSRKLVDAYIEAFPDTFLLSMIGTHGCRYAASLRLPNVGWRGDGFLDTKHRAPGVMPDGLTWHHMFDEYPRQLEECGLTETWKTAPVSIEPYSTVHHLLAAGGRSGDIDWQLAQCLKYHPSTFMAKCVEIPEKWMDRFLQFNRRLGYRFHLHQIILPLEARPGETVEVPVTIDNQGIAPIYRPYRLALRFVQDGVTAVVPFRQDLRRWLPDLSFFHEPIVIPPQLTSGIARIDVGIVDAAQAPVVKLAIRNVVDGGWHPLAYVDIRGHVSS